MNKINIAIIGSRDLRESKFVQKQMADVINDYLVKNNLTVNNIVSGGARGADKLAEHIFFDKLVSADKIIVFTADWNAFGKAAGMIRNKYIEEASDICFAFVNKPIEHSRGTFNCFMLFKNNNKPAITIEVKDKP